MGAFNGENDDGECVPLPVFIGEWGWELNVKGKDGMLGLIKENGREMPDQQCRRCCGGLIDAGFRPGSRGPFLSGKGATIIFTQVSHIESCRRRPTESVPWQTHVLHIIWSDRLKGRDHSKIPPAPLCQSGGMCCGRKEEKDGCPLQRRNDRG